MTNAPTTRETADHIGEANEKVADHIGDATTMIDHAELARAIGRLLPITTHDTPDYAEVSFGECQAQAMTMEPDTWLALNQLPALLSEIAALRAMVENAADGSMGQTDKLLTMHERATQAERQRDELRKALEAVISDCNLAAAACDNVGPRAGFHHVANDARQVLANQGAE